MLWLSSAALAVAGVSTAWTGGLDDLWGWIAGLWR